MNDPVGKMPSGKWGLLVVLAVGLLILGFLSVWIFGIYAELERTRLQKSLARAVEIGDSTQVLALIAELDPDGRGLAGDWTGEEVNEPGFPWLLKRWRELGHETGEIAIFERWVALTPDFPRNELEHHLQWLWSRKYEARFKELFFAIYLIDLQRPPEPGSDDLLSWLRVITVDEDLVYTAWEVHRQYRSARVFPEPLISFAIAPERLSKPDRIESILFSTGLLDPPETFELILSPWSRSEKQLTWVEWIYEKVFASSNPSMPGVKAILETRYFPICDPDTLGMYFLRCLVEDSPEPFKLKISGAHAGSALDRLVRTRESAKPKIASFLARRVFSFHTHPELREWVWTHHESEWSDREKSFEKNEGSDSRSNEFGDWVKVAVKLGRADRAAPVIVRIWQREVAEVMSAEPLTPFLPRHPFEELAIWKTPDGRLTGEQDPGAFGMLLELAKHPDLVPEKELPKILSIDSGNGESVNLDDVPLDQVFGLLNEIGELYENDPVRFMIVPTFKNLLFRSGGELAAFQKEAEGNRSPGAWLAADIAEMQAYRFCYSAERTDAVESAGGHKPKDGWFDKYFNDRRAPAAARVSFALNVLNLRDPSFHRTFRPLNPTFSAPRQDLDQLMLDFAAEYAAGRWPEDLLSPLLEYIVASWMLPETGNQAPERIATRTKARRLLGTRLESLAPEKIERIPSLENADKQVLNVHVLSLLKSYMVILRLEGKGFELVQLWHHLEGVLPDPDAVFNWVPDEVIESGRTESYLAAIAWSHAFRKQGSLLSKHDEGRSHPGDVGDVMSEASSQVTRVEWMRFCNAVLNEGKELPGDGIENHFHMIVPGELLFAKKNVSVEDRIQWLLNAVSYWTDAGGNESFYRLALPPLFRQVMKTPGAARQFSEALAKEPDVKLRDLMLEAANAASNGTGTGHQEPHLLALRDPAIPLAQRWLSANYFLVARLEKENSASKNLADWSRLDRELVEVSADLLIEAAEAGLPVWQIANRGLGGLDEKSHQKLVSLASFRNLHSADPQGQSGRATRLLEPEIARAITEGTGTPEPNAVLHSLAVAANDQKMAAALLAGDQIEIGMARRIKQLNASSDWIGLAGLLAREWRSLDEVRAEDGIWLRDGALPKILDALPEDPELRLLTRIALFQQWPGGWYEGGTRFESDPHRLPLVRDFVSHSFSSPEMERYCFHRLDPRVSEVPELEVWIQERLGETEWRRLLQMDSRSFRERWPIWSKWLQLRVDKGDFASVEDMMPDESWFNGTGRTLSQMPAGTNETREEMVWMGFAKALARCIAKGPHEDRSNAAGLVGKLLSRPPVLNRSAEPEAVEPSTGGWSFHARALLDLSDMGAAQTLIGTLDASNEVAISETDPFLLPLKTGGPLRSITPYEPQGLVGWIVFLSASLTESEKDQVFLRAFETQFFQRNPNDGQMPCSNSMRYPSFPRAPVKTMLRLAQFRFEEDPENALRMADYGYALVAVGKERGLSLELLDRATKRLDPANIYQESLLRDIKQLLEEARTAK